MSLENSTIMENLKCNSCEISLIDFSKFSQSELYSYLQRHGVLLQHKSCEICGADCKLRDSIFRCTGRVELAKTKKKRLRSSVQCTFSQSIRKLTFFDNSKLSIDAICKFVILSLLRIKNEHDYIARVLHWSPTTVSVWTSFLREVFVYWSKQNAQQKLGGPGKVVEIDETKVGRMIDGKWVFGGIERDTKSFFMCPVELRNSDTLLACIQENIAEGTTIVSDCWKAYNCLEEAGFKHFTVNRSVHFVDPESGEHTQNIVRLWRDLKDYIPKYGWKSSDIEGYLAKFQFFKKYPDTFDQVHQMFLNIGSLYNPYNPKDAEKSSSEE